MKRDRRRMVKGHPIFVMSHWSSSVRTPDSQSGDRRFKSDMRYWVPWCGQWGSGLPAPRNPSGGTCSKGATDPCKIGVKGSIPFVSTHNHGSQALVVMLRALNSENWVQLPGGLLKILLIFKLCVVKP